MLLEAGIRLRGQAVAEALTRVGMTQRLPRSITVDHGTEFTSKALDHWAWKNGVALDFTRPGKPTDNGPSDFAKPGQREVSLRQPIPV